MGRGRHKHDDDGGRQPAEHQRTVPTYGLRLKILTHYEKYGMDSTLAHFYKDIGGTLKKTKKKNVYLYIKAKAKIELACASGCAHLTRLRQLGTATTLPREAEQHIVLWLNNYRDEGLPVSLLMLESKALAVARDIGILPPLFAASWAWCNSFLKRHRRSLRARTRQGQVRPADSQLVLDDFNKKVRQKMAELDVDVVYNTDQTPVLFEYLPKSTIDKKGSHTVWVRSGGKDKERITCMLLGDSMGRKHAPFLVLKTVPSKVPEIRVENTAKRHGFGRHLWDEVQPMQQQHGVEIYGNKTGWWVEALSVAFLRYHFGNRADISVPVLLLWDDFAAHWTDAVRACAKELNIELMRVPPGCTSVCQPADVAWNRPLKSRMRQQWILYLEVQLRVHETAMQAAAAFRFEPPSRREVVSWVTEAWRGLTADNIANGFNGILAEPTLSVEEQDEMDGMVERLGRMRLLDSGIGEVTCEHDVIGGSSRRRTVV